MFFLMVAVKKRNLPANNIVISTMFIIKLNSTVFECRYNLQVLGRFTGD